MIARPQYVLRALLTALLSVAVFFPILSPREPVQAQSAPRVPRATLASATRLRLPGGVDSNSPAVWVDGTRLVHLFTSINGEPSIAAGTSLTALGRPQPVVLEPRPPGGNWIEAVVSDDGGTWYGYYHNERVAGFCPGTQKVAPRIGAMRSYDHGRTWEDLGIILDALPVTADCDTLNEYFVGGVGDFSVMLDEGARDLYVFFTQYLRRSSLQGVAVARLAWADRDDPVGKITVWSRGAWLPARRFLRSDGTARWIYPAATPIYRAAESWHDDDTLVDAFWGPSVHWNTYLRQYVMLLNRARDVRWNQEGIYVSFAPRLDDPGLWSEPVKILNGGSWYPQVLGLEPRVGTDKVAGETARFFMAGRSDHIIRFSR